MKKLTILFFIITLFHSMTTFSQTIPPPQYSEAFRPQFHFSPPTKWMNDPNGMVYYAGEYHLFFQYHPFGDKWGPMHWGHAISKDLIHWEHLPIALEPDSLGYIFSGSVVVDSNNTSGFKTGKESPLVAMFTYHNMDDEKRGRNDYQYQAIAFSNDKGRTWTKYKGNPVISNTEGVKNFRDTKVFWHQPTKHWVVIFAVGDHVRFYNSKDLKNWTLTGSFGKNEGAHGGVWECPDLFPLKIESTKTSKWVMLLSLGNGAPNGGSGTQYFIGHFNGKTFINDNKPNEVLWLDYGRDNYAGVTWSNAPKNRRIFLGWMSNWQYAQDVPTTPWRSAMTLPRELSLKKIGETIRIEQKVVPEISKIYDTDKRFEFIPMNIIDNFSEINVPLKSPTNFIHFNITNYLNTGATVHIELSNDKGEKYTFGYEVDSNKLFTDRSLSGNISFSEKFASIKHYTPVPKQLGFLNIDIYMDKSSIEIFEKHSGRVITELFFPSESFNKLTIKATKVREISNGYLIPLKSIW